MSIKSKLSRTVCFLAGTSLCFLPTIEALAQEMPPIGGTLTTNSLTDTTVENTRTILTDTFSAGGSIGINRFSSLNLNTGLTLDLVQPQDTTALVNIVTGGSGSVIAGQLVFSHETGASSNAFLVDPQGISVVNSGSITGQRLTLSTARSDATVESIVDNTAALTGAEISVADGGTINAESVSFWTAGNLALHGLISAKAPDGAGTAVTGAVNTSHVQQATQATVQGGVIRFGAGSATVGGTATLEAQRQELPAAPEDDPTAHQGGQIRGEVASSLVLEAGSVLSVAGIGYDAGSVALNSFQGGTLWIDDAAIIDASSDTGQAGLIYAQAGNLNLGGSFDLAGASAANGAALLTADAITFGGSDAPPAGSGAITNGAGILTTNGGDLTLVAQGVTLNANASLDTASGGDAGDVSILAPTITVTDATITAGDARVALVADAQVNARGLFLDPAAPAVATITLDGAQVDAGAIVISATAIATNTVSDTEADDTQAAYNAADLADGSISNAIDALTDAAIAALAEQRNAVVASLPLEWEEVRAEASVIVTDTQLTATGNWADATSPTVSGNPTATHGFFGANGADQVETRLIDQLGVSAAFSLNENYDPTAQSLYIQGHAQTAVDIAPEVETLSLAVAKTSTNSLVSITQSDLVAQSDGITLASTAFEHLNLGVSVNGGSAPTTIAIAQKALNNQLLVQGGSIAADGGLVAGAFTGKSHQISNATAGNGTADLALGLTYATSNSLTQAALGGTIGAASLDLGAETLSFANTHTTTATMAAAPPDPDADEEPANNESSNDNAAENGSRVQSSLTGEDDSGTGNTDSFQDKTAVGAAIDVQLFNDTTTATLGGDYLGTGDSTLSIGVADVTVPGAVTVNAAQRYATADEAGAVANPSLTRAVRAQMGSIGEIIDANTDDSVPETDDKKFAFFYAMSLAELGGSVTAEIGADAVLRNAGDVTVNALTQYQTFGQATDFRGRFDNALQLSGLLDLDPTNTERANPDFTRFQEIFDPDILLTTTVGVQTVDSSDAASDQERSLGVSVNLFETDNDTRALVSDGASILTAGDVRVVAGQEGLFFHGSATGNAETFLTGGGGAGSGALVGGNVSVPRLYSNVQAIVGDATLTDIGNLDVLANNDVIQFTAAKSGGLEKASSVAINAAVAAAVLETETLASLGAGVVLDAATVTINADDQSRLLTIAGALGASEGAGAANASGAINIVRRDTRAVFGLDTGNAGSFAADALVVSASNDGTILAAGVAGSLSSGSNSAPAGDMSIPGGLLGSAGAESEFSGNSFAATGSLALNLMLQNDARAIIQTGSVADVAGAVTVSARNATDDYGLAGGISASYGQTGDPRLIAGAVAYKRDNRSAIVDISAASIMADTVIASADDSSRAIYVAATGTGAATGTATAALAGSLVRIEETGATAVTIRDSAITTDGAMTVTAENANAIIGVAGGIAATTGRSVGLSSAQVDSSRDAQVNATNTTWTVGSAAVSARQAPDATLVSVSVAAGQLGGGGTAVVSIFSGSAMVNADALIVTGPQETSPTDPVYTGLPTVDIVATQASLQSSNAGGLSAGTRGAIGAASANSINRGGAQVLLNQSEIYAQSIRIAADALANLQTRSFGLNVSGGAAVGIATAVNTSAMQVLTDINDSRIFARDSILVDAAATTDVTSLAISLQASTNAGAAGSAIYNEVGNTVSSVVRGDNGGSDLRAGGTIAVLSQAKTVGALLGGDEGLPDSGGGSVSAAGTAAIGLTVTINDTNNQVSTRILDETLLLGFGNSTLDLGSRLGTAATGVVVDAFADTSVDTLAATVALAGKAAVTAAFTYNTLADNAVVQIGNGIDPATGIGDGHDVSINNVNGVNLSSDAPADQAFAIFYNPAPEALAIGANQRTQITSGVENSLDDWAVLIAGSGGAAIGAAGSGNLILSRAETTLNSSNITALTDVMLGADVVSTINTTTLGLSAATAAGSASVGYSRVRSDAQLNLSGARVSAGRDAVLRSDNRNTIHTRTGVVAAGKVAGAGAAVTNVIAGTSTVTLGAITTLRRFVEQQPVEDSDTTDTSSEEVIREEPAVVTSNIVAGGLADVFAESAATVSNTTVSGGLGAAAAAFSVAVNLIDTETKVVIGAGQAVDADDIRVRAFEETTITDLVGAGAAAAGAFGGSVNYVDFNGGTTVEIGDGATLSAVNSLSVDALADRTIDTQLGVATVAAGSLSAVVSVINVDGSAGEGSSAAQATIDQAQVALSEDQLANASGTGLIDATGANSSVAQNQTARRSTDVSTRLAPAAAGSAEGLRDVGVQIGASARLISDGTLAINALVNADISQQVGLVTGSGVSVSASVGVVNLSSRVDVVVQRLAQLEAVDGLTINAQTTTGTYDVNGDATDAPDTSPAIGSLAQGDVASAVTAIAISAGANIGAGASLVDLSSQARVDVLDGVQITAGGEGARVDINATRADRATANIVNIGAAALGSLGVTYTRVRNTGRAEAFIGRPETFDANGIVLAPENVAATLIAASGVGIRTLDQTSATANAQTAQGGGFLALAGANAVARNSSANALTIDRTRIAATGTVALENLNRGVAQTDARGLAVGGAGALVTSIALSELNAALTTDLNATAISAERITVITRVTAPQTVVENVKAAAQTLTLAGGAAGSGAFADAKTAYTATLNIGGGSDAVVSTALVAQTGSLVIRTGAQDVTTSGVVKGTNGAAVAIGAVFATVGQGAGAATAINNINSGLLAARENLIIDADNDQNLIVDVTTGAGGVVAADVSKGDVLHRAVSTTNIGTAGEQVTLIAGDPSRPDDTRFNGALTLRAVQSVDLTSTFDNTLASLVGLSGAVSNNDFNADVDVVIGGGTNAFSNFAEISAQNNVFRRAGVRNMNSLSGGLATGAVLDSDVTGEFTVDTRIDAGALLVQIGDPDLANRYRINTRSFYNIGDYLVVDATGAVAAPFGDSNVNVTHTDNVTIAGAEIRASGDLEISSGASANITAQQNSTASGLAGVPSAKANATYVGTSTIDVAAGSLVESLSDIAINAGYVNDTEQDVRVSAEARVFNRTATPISFVLRPVANATGVVNSAVNIAAGADVIGYQNIYLNASEGVRDVRGYGLAKDFYLELASDAAALVGVSLVLDIKTGTSTSTGRGVVDIAGQVRSGAYNRRVLNFNSANVVDNANLALPDGVGVESADSAPSSEFYTVTEDSDERARLTAAKAELESRRAAMQPEVDVETGEEIIDPVTGEPVMVFALDPATREQLLGVIQSYDRRIASLGSDPITRIDVAYLRASEGSVQINATELTGSSSGSLFAADEADIRIFANSGALVSLQGLEITEVEGGEITFNGTLLTADDPGYAFDVSFAENFGDGPAREGSDGPVSDNSIEVVVSDVSGGGEGDIEIVGRVVNRQGGVDVISAAGSIYAQANVVGESVNINAAGSLEIASPDPGIVAAGPSPFVTRPYGPTPNVSIGLIQQMEQDALKRYQGEVNAQQGRNIDNYRYVDARSGIMPAVVDPSAALSAGGNIVLVGQYINISGPVRAGTGEFEIGFDPVMQTDLNTLAGVNRSDRVQLLRAGGAAMGPLLLDEVAYVRGMTAATNAEVYYNFATNQVEIDPIRTNGGAIFITGDVISTGNGSLEAIDGQGRLQLNSSLTTDVVFNTVDLRGSTDQSGLIRIRDLSKPIREGGQVVDFVTRDYRSRGDEIAVFDNYDPATGIRYVDEATNSPSRLLRETTGSSEVFTPNQGRDVVYVTQDIALHLMARYKVELVQGNWNFGHNLVVSDLYRDTVIPLSAVPGFELGTLFEQRVFDYAEPDDRYSPVQASLGGYDYRYSFSRSQEQLRTGQLNFDAESNAFDASIYGGGTQRLAQLESQPEAIRALVDQQAEWDLDIGAHYWQGNWRNGPTVDINLAPGNQSLLRSLVYNINPSLVTDEADINKLHTIVHAEEFLMLETTTHEHRIRADHDVAIRFTGGSGASESALNSEGNIIFNRDVTAPENDLTVRSERGSILTASPTVSLTANALDLQAPNGRIGGLGGASARLAMVEGGIVTATARDSISLEEIGGSLRLGNVTTTNRDNEIGTNEVGGIDLRAAGSITQTATGLIDGYSVALDARAGGIGEGSSAPLRVITDGGALNVSSQGDVDVITPSGDLGLGTIESITGSVRLEAAAGAVLDRNSEEVADLRTIEALKELWGTELGLTDTLRIDERVEAQLAAYEAGVVAQYHAYWQARNAAGGAPLTYVLDATTRDALSRAGDTPEESTARADAFVAQQQAFYDIWNAQETFNADYNFRTSRTPGPSGEPTREEILRNQMSWSLDELILSVDEAVVTNVSTTSIRDESPNITAAQDITVVAANGVGEILDGYVIAAPSTTGQPLSDRDLAILASALPGDLTNDGNGNTIVRQEDDINLSFGLIEEGALPDGVVTVTTDASDVFIGSKEAARIARVAGADRVELRTNGALLNAATSGPAITGTDIQLESGIGGIGSAQTPLTVQTLPGGTLRFAAGTDAYVDAPEGDIALVGASAGGLLTLNVLGDLTDAIGSSAERIRATDVIINAATIGTDAQIVGIRQEDATGSVALTSRDGGIYTGSQFALALGNFDSAAGGRIVMGEAAPLTFAGLDTVRFATDATLGFVIGAPVTSTDAVGTDIVGGTLDIAASADWGTAETPVTTNVRNLRYTATLPAGDSETSDVFLTNTGTLAISSFMQSDNPLSTSVITTTGDLGVGTAVTAGRLLLQTDGALEIGAATADRLELAATGDIGAIATARISANTLDAVSEAGTADITLFGRDTVVERLHLSGATAALALTAESGTTTLRDDAIKTVGAAQTLRFAEGLVMDQGLGIETATGTIDLQVDGDFALGTISTGATGADALQLTVGGAVSVVDATALNLIADAAGAGTTLSFTDATATSPLRVKTQIDTLTMAVAAQDVHIDEATDVTIMTAETGGAIFELYATGDVQLGDVSAADTIVVSSLGGIAASQSDLLAPEVYLFAFGGSITTAEGAAFGVQLAEGAVLNQFARDNITTTFGSDAGRLGYAIAQTGDLTVDRTLSGGVLEADILAAGGTMTLRALGSIDIDFIGRGEIDLIDEQALALVVRDPNRFGLVQFTGPENLIIEALNPDAEINIGLAEIKQTADLNAAVIDANLYDLTPDAGLRLQLSGAQDGVADLVAVNVIADDPAFTGTTGQGAPDISERLMAQIRPEDPSLPTASGAVTIDFGRFTSAEITTAGDRLEVSDVIIGDEAIFRQRLFDVFAETAFSGVRSDMDGQILAVPANGLGAGELAFAMFERRQIETANILTNRPDPTSVIEGGSGGREETLAELATYMTLDRDRLFAGHVARLPRGEGLAAYITAFPAKGAEEDDSIAAFLQYKSSDLPLVILRD
ncbi:hypothetical protein [Yoonia sp.]|uniref:hypothetical protein n=1 Tax=Yoonia sp. TaxID=2212373 RepID=UPI00358E9038